MLFLFQRGLTCCERDLAKLNFDLPFADTETYINPQTNSPTNVGVALFINTTIVRNYFDRLRVPRVFFNPSTDIPAGTPATLTYDLSSGFPIPASTPSEVEEQNLAFFSSVRNYTTNLLSKYPWIDQGFLRSFPNLFQRSFCCRLEN